MCASPSPPNTDAQCDGGTTPLTNTYTYCVPSPPPQQGASLAATARRRRTTRASRACNHVSVCSDSSHVKSRVLGSVPCDHGVCHQPLAHGKARRRQGACLQSWPRTQVVRPHCVTLRRCSCSSAPSAASRRARVTLATCSRRRDLVNAPRRTACGASWGRPALCALECVVAP